jgi:hypothetical protein
LSRSPETFPAQYSDEFLQAYVEDDWQVTDGNIHNIATMNTMVRWLNGPDDDFRKEIGYDKVEIYARWNGNLNDIPGKAEIEVVELPDDQVYYEGHQLVWKALTVKEPIAEGAYIGELKGQVELQSEYQQDPSNRWSNLKHPESFVFFHSKLPIVIDARQTGNELRYIRRSCTPNARLQILVTGGNEYHFCFMATQQIEPGVEITIAWDTHFSGLSAHQTQVDSEYLSRLSTWVSNVLANCGPCACQVPVGDCKMSRLDRRGKDIAEEAPSAKQPRSKKRRTNQHVSPINTNAVNSRSGSEARRVDNDEESVHSRSTSGSASRDITPNTHYSTNGLSSAAPELSERERKKLAKEEEMFRRQEEESSGKQAKKKRSSAGSNVNTPTAPSSAKQATFPASSSSSSRYTDAGTSRTPHSANTTSKVHARQKSRSSKVSSKPVTAVVKKPKPQYVDCSVQCDMDEEDAKARAATPLRKRNFMPLRQRLLERCARNNSLYNESRKSLSPPSASPVLDQMEIDSKHDERPLQSPTPGSATGLISPTSSTDESPIKSEADATHSSSPTKPDSPDPQALRSPPLNEPNAPSRPRSKASTPVPSSRGGTPGPQTKHPSLHVSMPPPSAETSSAAHTHQIPAATGRTSNHGLGIQTNSDVNGTSETVVTPTSTTAPVANPAATPSSLVAPLSAANLSSPNPSTSAAGANTSTPLLPPPTNVKQPSPSPSTASATSLQQQRKKMSLSEYASKRKNKSSSVVPTLGGGGGANTSSSALATTTHSRLPADRDASPGSTASGPIGTPSSADDRQRVLSSGSLSNVHASAGTESEMDVDEEEAVADDDDNDDDDDEGEYVPVGPPDEALVASPTITTETGGLRDKNPSSSSSALVDAAAADVKMEDVLTTTTTTTAM